jgi:HSP20 family molecular chaperone IbpA
MSTQPVLEAKTSAVPVKINAVESETLLDRAKEIYEAVARRAYELFDVRGRQSGYEIEDWLNAERELLRPLPLEVTETDDRLTVRAEVPGFSEKDLKVSLEPRCLIINGRIEEASEQKTSELLNTSRCSSEIFHSLDLPADIDRAKASATLKSGILELNLPKSAKTEATQVEVKGN